MRWNMKNLFLPPPAEGWVKRVYVGWSAYYFSYHWSYCRNYNSKHCCESSKNRPGSTIYQSIPNINPSREPCNSGTWRYNHLGLDWQPNHGGKRRILQKIFCTIFKYYKTVYLWRRKKLLPRNGLLKLKGHPLKPQFIQKQQHHGATCRRL